MDSLVSHRVRVTGCPCQVPPGGANLASLELKALRLAAGGSRQPETRAELAARAAAGAAFASAELQRRAPIRAPRARKRSINTFDIPAMAAASGQPDHCSCRP